MTPEEKIDLFWKRWHDLNALYEDYARKVNRTDLQLSVLDMVRRTGGCTQKAIRDRTLLPKQNVNGTVKGLAREGLLALVQDEADRRSKVIHLTEKGEALLAGILPRLWEAETAALSALTKPEQDAMIAGMGKYVAALKKEMEEGEKTP